MTGLRKDHIMTVDAPASLERSPRRAPIATGWVCHEIPLWLGTPNVLSSSESIRRGADLDGYRRPPYLNIGQDSYITSEQNLGGMNLRGS